MTHTARDRGEQRAGACVLVLALCCACGASTQTKTQHAEASSAAPPAVASSGEPELRAATISVEAAERAASSGDRAGAQHLLLDAALRARTAGRSRLAALLLHRVGRVQERGGDIQAAVTTYERSLAELRGRPELDIGASLEALARSHKGFVAPRLSAAEDLFSALGERTLVDEEADSLLDARILVSIGNAYLMQPQPAPARVAYAHALERARAADDLPLQARLLTHLAIADRQLGNVVDAASSLRAARAAFQRLHDRPGEAKAIVAQAAVQIEAGDHAGAAALYREALSHHPADADGLTRGRVLTALGGAELQLQHLPAARAAFEQALPLSKAAADSSNLLPLYYGLGLVARAAGELGAAREHLSNALRLVEAHTSLLATDEGKVSFMDASGASVVAAALEVQLLASRTDTEALRAALELSERFRGRALLDLASHRRRLRAERLAPELPGRVDIAVQSAPATASATLPPELVEPERARRPVAALARLSFHVLPAGVVTFLVRADGSVFGHLAQIERAELLDHVQELRGLLGAHGDFRGRMRDFASTDAASSEVAQVQQRARALYALLIEPLAAQLPGRDEPLAIVPHDALWLLPFAALVDPAGRSFGERPLLWTASLELLEDTRTTAPHTEAGKRKLLAVGNPVMPSASREGTLALQPLPGAEREASVIAALWPTGKADKLLRERAKLTEVLKLAGEYDVLHFATHALSFADAPLDSFMVLGESPGDDGRLTAQEVLAHDWRAELVVLSACETGLGRTTSDGVIGLGRSFLAAGVRSVLVSLWSIDDAVTVELMTLFYRGYRSGKGKGLALRDAIAGLRRHHDDPRYWAAFALLGAED